MRFFTERPRTLGRIIAFISAVALVSAQPADPALTAADQWKQGHSRHGDAFDAGPRTKPVEMKDIGHVHFPITTKSPEVQKWFDQGVTLLHSFWDYEAERSFRWCLKLEPDNAMAYWGLARAASNDERSREFLAEAVKRKNKVSERERLYIESLEPLQEIESLRDRAPSYRDRNDAHRRVLETICVRYPDDMEARALLALASMGESRYGTEQMVREILAVQPDHPGAHHYRIHNWNHHEPEQALVSCRRYSEIAPGIGHAQHMPGHIYATVGMWNEAAISMDAATRTEIRRMQEQLVFPFNYWNYGHNRNYLSYIQEQLGMASASMTGARQLVEAPLDPKFNADGMYSSHTQGLRAMLRNLIKFEKWDEIVSGKSIPWRDTLHDRMMKSYGECRAWIAKGERFKAERALEIHSGLGREVEKEKSLERIYKIQQQELNGRLDILKGSTLLGLGLLAQAAEDQYDEQQFDNDPPHYPQFLYPELGRAYLDAGSPQLAVKAFEKALTRVRNDLFSLAGLVEAHHALGQEDKARSYMARLLYVTANADKGVAVLERAKVTGVTATPADQSPAPQRSYVAFTLSKYGPALWDPFKAPALAVVDHENKKVSLDDYKGKNVILVFYLGRECLHCMKQLQDIAAKSKDWQRLDTVVLAVSPNKPSENAENLKTLSLPGVRFLSDENATNTRRFRAYDDFEEMEVHSTILIDKQGRVHWARTGGEPFGDMAFLEKQLGRMNASPATPIAAGQP